MKTFKITFLLFSALLMMNGCKKDVPKPVADFSYSPANVKIDEQVTFTNKSKEADNYEWDFGDGNLSVDENPLHVYKVYGWKNVVLKAINSSGSDTAVRFLNVEVPEQMVTIFEGAGISQIKIADDTWKSVRDSFPGADTSYYSSYVPDNNVYVNQVYYTNKGIVFAFLSAADTLQEGDPVLGIILFPPYQGFTAKSISIGSSVASLKHAYGQPESIDDLDKYTGYQYSSLGIDFYTYHEIDENIITEIDIYLPGKKAASIKEISTSQIQEAWRKALQ